MIRVADYVIRRLADYGVRHIFLLVGGGAMHLNNAIAKERRIMAVCNHHEQACAMAAEAYSKAGGGVGVVNVTTGPGGINALNGVFGAWTDSVPMVVLSGQVKRETCMATYGIPGLRQLGEQEADIIAMARGITKYAALVQDPMLIRYHLERALHLATSERPGPCWLDIPLDVQGAVVDETRLAPYDAEEDHPCAADRAQLHDHARTVLEKIRAARRPIILYGNGIRCAGAEHIFETVARKLGVPLVPSRSMHDFLSGDDPLVCGYPGIDCDRAGNFAVQNADVLVVLGSHLGYRLVGYKGDFAKNAYRIRVDIDAAELRTPHFETDLAIRADLRTFLEELDEAIDVAPEPLPPRAEWLAWCKERVARYPVVLERHRASNGYLNPYPFFEVLFQSFADAECVVATNGTAYQLSLQVPRFLRGQRLIFNNGCMSMGYELPAAIGAAFANPGRRIACLAGDGSLQLNIQELQTIRHHSLPVKIFLLNNGGYLSIRLTQNNFFEETIGESASSGVSFPDFAKVAEAYGLASMRIDSSNFTETIRTALETPGPVLADVRLDPQQGFEPKVASRRLPDGRMVSSAFEDMSPFLSREELRSNMLAPYSVQSDDTPDSGTGL